MTTAEAAALVVRLVRELAAARRARDAYREALQAAVAVIRARDEALTRLRDTNAHLRAQVRAAVSGRTLAEERQAIEAEAAPDSVRSAA
ncbi:MAG: hypothetical protein IT177_01625 [Acidobacteria bacterium]|nr:hypothetical protein [Acidobacteriota bacterium]